MVVHYAIGSVPVRRNYGNDLIINCGKAKESSSMQTTIRTTAYRVERLPLRQTRTLRRGVAHADQDEPRNVEPTSRAAGFYLGGAACNGIPIQRGASLAAQTISFPADDRDHVAPLYSDQVRPSGRRGGFAFLRATIDCRERKTSHVIRVCMLVSDRRSAKPSGLSLQRFDRTALTETANAAVPSPPGNLARRTTEHPIATGIRRQCDHALQASAPLIVHRRNLQPIFGQVSRCVRVLNRACRVSVPSPQGPARWP